MPSSYGGNREHPREESAEAEKPPEPDSPPVSDYDEWEMEERLRHLDRIYARSPLRGPLTPSNSHQFRFDSQHASVPREQAAAVSPEEPRAGWIARLGQFGLFLGMAVTVCGGCLMGLGQYGARPDLMPLGVPIAAVGLIFLLLGLALQLDSSETVPRPTAKRPADRPAPPTSNANIRFDDGPDASHQLTDLAARMDELSRKLDEREER